LAPPIVSPTAEATIDFDAPLLWSQVPGAARYDVELCGDAACADVLARASGPNLYSLLHKPLGTIFWRVSAVDASGGRSPWSPVTRFTVAHVISGTVYEDRNADNDAAGLTPRSGVRVRLYRDRGDNIPGDDDPLVATTSTDKAGGYSFHPGTGGVYWVAIDEESFTPAGRVAGAVRAEQTFGGNGALCLQLDGSIVRRTGPGPCFGGRSMTPDDPLHLSASRHVASVAFGAGSLSEVDFGFSFNAVTSTAEGLGSGTFRQFVVNANAIRGDNTMHFVPLTHAPNGKWWSIRLTSPLPALTDAGTTIDGTAYSIVDPKYAIDSNKEVLMRSSNHVVTGKPIVGPERPELELILTGDRGIDAVAPAAAMPHYFREAGPAHQVSTVLLSGTLEPDVWVDISATVDRKGEAVGCHRSQFPDGEEWAATAVRLAAEDAGRRAGVGCAEGFRRLRLGG